MPQRTRPGRPRAAAGDGPRPADATPAGTRTIVWLASYPKSGNTWTRAFLANYLVNPDSPVPINHIRRFAVSDAAIELYGKVAPPGFDPAHPVAHLRLRERVLRAIAGNGADMNFVKSHNINGTVSGTQLIMRRYTRAAVYVVRNPLDVAISYARHFGMAPSRACQSISRSDNTTAGGERNVKQFLGSWAEHVLSWTGATDFPVHVMRYEDMRADPHGCFRTMLDRLGIPVDGERLDRAVRFSSFEELQRQEKAGGFVEASRNTERFFHSGTSGQWQGVLSDEDIATVRQANQAAMRTYGYL